MAPVLPESIWVAELWISDRTAHKIMGRGVHADELRQEIVCVAGLPFTWDDDPERGRRAILQVSMHGRRWLVVLYPVAHPMGDVWNLGSVYEA